MLAYYEDILKMEMEEKKRDAIIMAQCVAYAQPAWSQKDVSTKAAQWKKFLDSLDPNKLIKREEKRKDPLKSLLGVVPVFNAPKDIKEL